MGMNSALKKRFESKFSGATVNLDSMSVQKAIEDVVSDKAEVAAIGRPLTDDEKAKGLSEVFIGRDKIAVVVTPDNAFTQDLTIPKFAKIFRGEITNWSDLGGRKEPINFVDRINSDTRQALAGYPQFKTGNFDSGKNAVKLEDTSMKALLETLKSSGVSFVPANQAKTQTGLRALTLHGVFPTDSRYPFSQPLYYVYKGNAAAGMRNEVKALLGFLGTTAGQESVKIAGITPAPKAELLAASGTSATEKPDTKSDATKAVGAKAGGEKVPGTGTTVRSNDSPSGLEGKSSEKGAATTPAIAPEQDGNLFGLPFPSWLRWLLPLGLLGMGLLLLLLPRKSDRSNVQGEDSEDRGFGNPLSGAGNALGDEGRNTTKIVENTATSGGAASIGLAANNDAWTDSDGAPYIKDDTDLSLIDPAKTVAGNAPQAVGDFTGAGAAAAAGMGVAAGSGATWEFLKGNGTDAIETSPERKSSSIETPTINLASSEVSDFSVAGQEWDFGTSSPSDRPDLVGDSPNDTAGTLSDRSSDKASGIGSSASGFFSRLKDSASAIADGITQTGSNAGATAGAAAIGGAAAISGTAAGARTRLVGDRAGIVLIPQTAREAVVRWQLTEAQKIDARNQGGVDLALRLYDVTGINPDRDPLENFYQYDCSELTQELRIEVPVPARDYVVEVGYLDRASEWIGIDRSLPVNIPAA